MAPRVEAFPPSQLPERAQKRPDGKVHKPPVKLAECELKGMLQYMCNLKGPVEDPRSRVECEPVMRMFRRCANGLMVETTGWEGVYD